MLPASAFARTRRRLAKFDVLRVFVQGAAHLPTLPRVSHLGNFPDLGCVSNVRGFTSRLESVSTHAAPLRAEDSESRAVSDGSLARTVAATAALTLAGVLAATGVGLGYGAAAFALALVLAHAAVALSILRCLRTLRCGGDGKGSRARRRLLG